MKDIILVGFGFMGTMHAQVYSNLPNARISAVVDTRKAKSKKTMATLGVDAPLFEDLNSALCAVPCDAVDICLPTDLHLRYALQAIAAGKHLFCEKPVALTLTDARRLEAVSAEAGVSAQVGQCIRFWPEYMEFVDFVKSGKAGELRSLTLQRRSMIPTHSEGDWLLDPKRSGGAAVDLHIHDTDFILSLLGMPTSVSSTATVDHHGPSHIFTTYGYKGLSVTAEGGWNYPPKWGFQMAFQAVFSNGAAEYDSGASPSISVTIGRQAKKALPFREPSIGRSIAGAGNISSLGGYFNELQSFVACLEKGVHPKAATLTQAADSLEVVLAEVASARSGKPISLTTKT